MFFGFHVIPEWFSVIVFESFTNDVIYVVPLGFSKLSFAFFLEMFVFFKIPSTFCIGVMLSSCTFFLEIYLAMVYDVFSL